MDEERELTKPPAAAPALRIAGFGLVWVLVMSGTASAQWSNVIKRAGVGVSGGLVTTADDNVDMGGTLGLTGGFAPRKGWGITAGFGWVSGDLLIEQGGATARLGTVRFRPLLGGVGYTWVEGKLATTASVTAGISFNSADLDEAYRATFGPGAQVGLTMDNSFAVRPAIDIEYTVHPKFAVTAFSGFFLTSVTSALNTPLGRLENELNASSFTAAVGVMVYPFR